MKSFLSLLIYVYLFQASFALYRSPLFGGSDKGGNFDDRAYSMTPKVIGFTKFLIQSSTTGIKGVQATYELEDGQIKISPFHGGNAGPVNNSIGIGVGMPIVRIEGELSSEGNTSQQHLTSLTLYVRYPESLNLAKYGPYGGNTGSVKKHPFGFPGIILGLFGQSNDDVEAIGFDIDTSPSPAIPYYKKTSVVGVDIGKPFDDALDSLSPVKIKTLKIQYSDWIDGIETTYVLRNGTTAVKGHGAVLSEDHVKAIASEDVVIDLADDEWILRIDAGVEDGKGPINYLKIKTRDSQGMWKSYGPYGHTTTSDIVTIDGTIAGFYGYKSERVNALGFYF